MARAKITAKLAQNQARMAEILKVLKRDYPEAHCSLIFKTPFQLLIATILSAQCTDERVNKVTPPLFKRFPDASAMAKATLPELEKLIHSAGFYKNKALSLKGCSQSLMEHFGGEVPRTLAELITLRGVGRKTANVVLGNAFDIPGLVVDTHVGRISRRLGFTAALDPEKVETEMMTVVPREDWTLYAHLLISHGRAICTSRRAFCDDCNLVKLCPRIGVA